MGSPQHLDPTREGESCQQEIGGARSLSAQGRKGATECLLLPSTNGDREPSGVGRGALRLHRYGKGGLAPQGRDVVPQDGLPRQKEAGWQRIAGVFCWRVSSSRLSCCLLSCIAVRENYAAEAEVLLGVHCSWWISWRRGAALAGWR